MRRLGLLIVLLITASCGTSEPSRDTLGAILTALVTPARVSVAQCNQVTASSLCVNNLNPEPSALSSLQSSCTGSGGTWVENVRCASDTSTVGACVQGASGGGQTQRVYYANGGTPYTSGTANADCDGRGGTFSPSYSQ